MCTIVTYWDKRQLIVGANRDEVLTRTSEDWKQRKDIFCPLDVKGGTWIGVNKFGLFVGLVNLDNYIKAPSKKRTRGALVVSALNCRTVQEANNKIMIEEDPARYKGCILVLGSREEHCAVEFNGFSAQSKELGVGLHTFTEWGIDNWDIERNSHIKEKFDPATLKELLQYHGNGTVETEICVHDPKETFQTRSSSTIELKDKGSKFIINYTNARPCKTERWNTKEILVEK